MVARKEIVSVLQLFSGFVFFAAGLFFLSLPFLPALRLALADALIASSEGCILAGAGLMVFSFLWIAAFYAFQRGRRLEIGMGGKRASVEASLIEKSLEECFKGHFEGRIVLSDIAVLGKKKLEIEVLLTPFDESLREELFVDVQKKIVPLLQERFGYAQPFSLIVKSR